MAEDESIERYKMAEDEMVLQVEKGISYLNNFAIVIVMPVVPAIVIRVIVLLSTCHEMGG